MLRDTRNPLFVFTMSLLTLGIYMVYWHFQMNREIRSFGGSPPTAWLQFVPLANLYYLYRFMDEGVSVLPTLNHSWLHTIFHVTLPFFSAGLVQHRVNQYYEQDVHTDNGVVELERVVNIVHDALQRGHDEEYITKKLEDRGVEEHYINEAYRIENKRNGYY